MSAPACTRAVCGRWAALRGEHGGPQTAPVPSQAAQKSSIAPPELSAHPVIMYLSQMLPSALFVLAAALPRRSRLLICVSFGSVYT